MYQSLNDVQKSRLFNGILAVVVLLAVFLAFKSLNTIKEFSYIGGGVYPANTITVSGTGEVLAIPDTAQFSFSVNEVGSTVAEAQDKASKKMNSILEALDDMGIEEKDIKTVGYNSNPRYEYRSAGLCVEGYCPPGRQVLVGYEVSQSISVKVRDTEIAGDALTKVGGLGASNISGLNFITDDRDALESEARDLAIKDAKEQAKSLAKSLGVKLVKIVSFNESGNYPIPYGYGGVSETRVMNQDAFAVAPELPVGENEIVSNVSITYEVR